MRDLIPDTNAFSQLHQAASTSDVPKIKNLLSLGADVNARDSHNWTPLHHAANESVDDSHLDAIQTLLNNQADVNARDESGGTALHWVAEKTGVGKTVRLLLDHGADVNAMDDQGESPVFFAVTGGSLEVVQMLIQNGSDVNVVNEKSGSSLMHAACCNPVDAKIVRCLLKSGLKADVLDFEGRTPLMDALVYEKAPLSTLRTLLKYSDVNKVNWVDLAGSSYYKMFLEHLAILWGLGIAVNPKFLRSISSRQDYAIYYRKLQEELMVVKDTKIFSWEVSFFRLLVGTKTELKNYARNNILVNGSKWQEKFALYGARMRKNLDKGLERRRVFDEVAVILSESVPIFELGSVVINDVLDCVSTKDLSKLVGDKK